MNTMMANNTKVQGRTSTNKPRPRKRQRGATRADKPLDTSQPSIFELIPEEQVDGAIAYYYDHPEQLPYRLSGAHQRASQRPLRIMLKFDEKIFERKVQLRPIPDCELEGVDPFSLDPVFETKDDDTDSAASTEPGGGSGDTIYCGQESLVMGDLLHGPRDYGYILAHGQTEQCKT
ncbi:unnamed protein product [Zymoseptoria tritici ST99CH_3D1]|uniref:Uncharacterized protein n=1 Tax=Zymoseptoria tritici ST99CH_1E4 TaxID=1276532 RepID=A0A2H1GP49_ZYMTR|nr:unnamed protein product [Zymoseptoria tritici ST99CH_1E4]SMR57760.1 unnamed protein product [Zymoseptoria tritici ST99CH_3D1]